jgi:hypothetical protein
MDVIDEDEELNYIDDGTPMETLKKVSCFEDRRGQS